jgi:hypothetical protein
MIRDYDLEKAFADAKAKTEGFIESYNAKLPTEECPGCHQAGHLPGLPCPECGHEEEVAFVIKLDTEFGYDAVEIRNRRKVIASFRVEEEFT